jgi:CspA family cold shock protein
MATGTVSRWIAERGFGFIEPDSGDWDIFCHISDVKGHVEALQPGQRVRFEQAVDDRSGKTHARNVELLEDRK